MKLALAPIPFFWTAEAVQAFYAEIAQTAVDIVYLGETVCYKRRGLRLPDWVAIGEMLVEHGKEVVLSSLVLVDGEVELKATRRLCANDRFLVEANDMSAVALRQGLPFVAGATLNLYNEDALTILAEAGASRFVAALELSGEALTRLRASGPAQIECEVLAFGRPALAYSARCFTARNFDRGKDACEWVCEQQPDGIAVATQEDASFLVINGLQIHAANPVNYITELETLRQARVDILRIAPEATGTATVIDAFRGALDQRYTVDEALALLASPAHGEGANGYWRGVAGKTHCP
ncbi:MAG TPA: U32 family peptidase [Acidiferrobacter sp.]|nr:U32 family peptidase [Acidiferrobacter sp.]